MAEMTDRSILSMDVKNITTDNQESVYVFTEADNALWKTKFSQIKAFIKNQIVTELNPGKVEVDLSEDLGTVRMMV